MIHLRLPELLHIAERALGPEFVVRDHGLLESALARPRTTLYGTEVYPELVEKAAALLDSVTRNRGLIDGNKRLGLASTLALLGMNGWRVGLTNDGVYELVMAIASGQLDDVPAIAETLRPSLRRW